MSCFKEVVITSTEACTINLVKLTVKMILGLLTAVLEALSRLLDPSSSNCVTNSVRVCLCTVIKATQY